ncbi:MAG: hypothetical protein DME32_03320 [Verrucomicrobia bacterium]|nr:MAG: hypothetical protein DME32_03320 [Verrucomicrobiota bacterium]
MKTIVEERRLKAPTITPQALAWDGRALWLSSRDLGTLQKKGLNDDRFVYRYDSKNGFKKVFACPDFTGSYLSYNSGHLYLSQWYEKRILKYDDKGNIVRTIEVGAEICGHTFVDGMIFVLRGMEKPNEDWKITRLDPREDKPEVEDLAIVPFASRSLTYDGKFFWSNHRAANEIIAFSLPK